MVGVRWLAVATAGIGAVLSVEGVVVDYSPCNAIAAMQSLVWRLTSSTLLVVELVVAAIHFCYVQVCSTSFAGRMRIGDTLPIARR